MHIHSIPIYLLPFLATTTFAAHHAVPRSLSVEIVDSATAIPPLTTPAPHLAHLDLRQAVAPAVQPAAAPAAPVQPAAAPAAPAAPVAGVGGGAAPAPAQPVAGATADPVTTIMVNTVVGGVTKQVAVPFTQSFGAAGAAPSVASGSIGLGTLTGQVGVVKTQKAKSEAVRPGEKGLIWEFVGVTMLVGALGVGGGVLGLNLL